MYFIVTSKIIRMTVVFMTSLLHYYVMENNFKAEQFINELTKHGQSLETPEHQRFVTLYKKLLTKIVSWADSEGLEIASIKRLGGGFVNTVVMVETVNGQSVVVKNFADADDAKNNKKSKKIIDLISSKDEEVFSDIVTWLDETTVISEKVEGESIRKKMEKLALGTISEEEASGHFRTLGSLLGSLHERTEQAADFYDETLVVYDKERVKNYISTSISNLIDVPISTEELLKKIDSIVTSNKISYIHGDAHVDQFFCSPKEDLVTVVDYDSMRHGDPLADVARMLSSIRAWSKVIKLDEHNEYELTKSFMSGYRKTRIENAGNKESEFDHLTIVIYELRLYFVELDQYDELRKTIEENYLQKNNSNPITEKDFYASIFANPSLVTTGLHTVLSEKEMKQLNHMCEILTRIKSSLEYISSIDSH